MKFSNIWGIYSKIDLKYPKISKQGVIQNSFCLMAIAGLLPKVLCKYISSENSEFLNTYRNIQIKHGSKKTRKLFLAEGEEVGGWLSEKIFLLWCDCQSNTKAIKVMIRTAPSGDLVVKD